MHLPELYSAQFTYKASIGNIKIGNLKIGNLKIMYMQIVVHTKHVKSDWLHLSFKVYNIDIDQQYTH